MFHTRRGDSDPEILFQGVETRSCVGAGKSKRHDECIVIFVLKTYNLDKCWISMNASVWTPSVCLTEETQQDQ